VRSSKNPVFGSATHGRRQHQTVNHLATFEVAVDDFIDIRLVDKGVPNTLGINHGHRATRAAIKATSLIDTNPAGACQLLAFNAGFAMIKSSLRAMLSTTALAVFTVVEAEKNMVFVIAGGLLRTHDKALSRLKTA
jgi:hypothetical protein